jgi:hypothetical protein
MLAAAALLAGTAAGAQSCHPVAVLLELRDAGGGRLDALSLDSVVTDTAGHAPPARVVSQPYGPTATPDSANLLQWSASGCRLHLSAARLYRGGEEMRLDFGVRLDSETRRGPSTFLVEAPGFRGGRFRLRLDPKEAGGSERQPRRLPAGRWTEVQR